MKNALLLILQANGHMTTQDVAKMVERTPECVSRHLRVWLAENKVGMVRGLHNTHVWYAMSAKKAEDPAPQFVERTLGRVREIKSLFSPEIGA
jgi:predicted ArsR family transcriptional regulator